MLKQRVITAVVLLAVLLPALFAPMVWPFAALSLLLTASAGWEWARLNRFGSLGAVLTGLVLALAEVAAWLAGWAVAAPRSIWWLAVLIWAVGGGLALRGGPSAWPRVPKALRWLIGCAAIFVAWLALSHAKAVGVDFLLSTLALVWAADIAAYFGGRAFGRRKLAPSISPGKSWEGVWSGMVGALALALAWIALDRHLAVDVPSLYTQLLGTWGWPGLVLGVIVLAAISVVGDLFESLVKRAAGMKDSSQLLPGHGGVLDRVDALLPVVPIALALALV